MILKLSKIVGLILLIGGLVDFGIVQSRPSEKAFEGYIKKYAKYMRPLKTLSGDRYCSSSSIRYKGRVLTLTNNHCCDAFKDSFKGDERRVGNHMEKVLYQSPIADVCVLTSAQKDTPIKLSTKQGSLLDPVLLFGWPRGQFLSPRTGHIVQKNMEVCIFYNLIKHCRLSNLVTTVTYGGNSGSPILNSRGEVVNLLYAKSTGVNLYGISVPYILVRAALNAAVYVAGKNNE